MTKRTKTTETIEQPELLQEAAETSPETTEESTTTLTAEQQYHNAGEEISRIVDTIAENHERIQEHRDSIAQIQERHREAKEAHSAAQANEQSHTAQIARQRALAKIGGAAEQATLQAMIAVQDNLAKITEEARARIEQAESGLAEIGGIIDSIEEIKADCDQLERDLEVMKGLESELLYQWGKDEQTALIEEIQAAQAEFAEKEKALREARSNLDEVQGSVKERLRYWPGLLEQVEEKHLQIVKEDPCTRPEEHVFKAKIAYMQALGKHGPQCRVMLHRNQITELLALPRPIIAELMHPRSNIWQERWYNGKLTRTNQLIESAEWHVDEARSGRYE